MPEQQHDPIVSTFPLESHPNAIIMVKRAADRLRAALARFTREES